METYFAHRAITHPDHQRSLCHICYSRALHTVLLTVTPAASCFYIRAARSLAFNRNPLSQRSRPGKVRPRLPNQSPTPSLPPAPPRRPPNSRHLRGGRPAPGHQRRRFAAAQLFFFSFFFFFGHSAHDEGSADGGGARSEALPVGATSQR